MKGSARIEREQVFEAGALGRPLAASLAAPLTALLVSVAYYAGAQLGFSLTFPAMPTSIFWLPNATMLAVFILAPPRRWWIYVLAVAPAHFAVELQHGLPPLTVLLWLVTNVGDAALAAAGIWRFTREARPKLDGFRDFALFLVCAILSPLVVSFLDAGIVFATIPSQDYWLAWHNRFRSNILTNIIWVPPVVIATTRGLAWIRSHPPVRHIEAGLLALALLLVGSFCFGARWPASIPFLLYAPFPLFLWAAARFGTGGVAMSLLGFSFLVIRGAGHGYGPFAAYAPGGAAVLALQVFLTLLAAPLLLMAALLGDRRRVEGALRDREAQYRSIFESTSDGVLITDLANRLVAANPAFSRLTGYSAERLRSIPLRSLFDFDDLQPFDSFLARAAAGESVRSRAICVREDRGLCHYEIQGQGFSYGGRPHVLSVVRDITDHQQAHRLLEERVGARTRELSTLLEISNTIASTLKLKPLFGMVLEQLKNIVSHTGATLFIVENDRLIVADHRGPVAAQRLAEVSVPIAEMAECSALRRSTPLIIDDLQAESPAARAYLAEMPPEITGLFGYARSLLVVPLNVRDRTIGVLRIDDQEPNRYKLKDATLAWWLANQAAVAVENARLYDQARELATLEERQRLARELHDSVTQTLCAATMLARLVPETWERDSDQGRRALAALDQMMKGALAEMRTLLLELRPAALLQAPIGDLLHQLAAAFGSRVDIPVEVDADGVVELPAEVHVTFYRIAQEALANVARHASASNVVIRIRCVHGGANLVIRDDGRGFDPGAVGADHMGLSIMQERASAVGAFLAVRSSPGQGTSVTLDWSGRRAEAARKEPDGSTSI
jgi:two-component system nitrate/nitrite sensor histidine kinase NarX